MAQIPAIYTIQAPDSPQHTGRLQEILQNLKTENRIKSFTTLDAGEDLSLLTDTVREEDLILVVLSQQLDSEREQIETSLKTLKSDQPGVRIGEIIVDNVPYENEFLTFPTDLRPIRDREDMDSVWSGIERSLKDMFLVQKVDPGPVPIDWPKYLKIAAVVIGLLVVFFVGKGLLGRNDEPALKAEAETQAVEVQVSEELMSLISEAREALDMAVRGESMEADLKRQIGAVRGAIEADQIEEIIASGSERTFVREIDVLKRVLIAMNEQVRNSEERVKAFEQRISRFRAGSLEADREVVRRWIAGLKEEKVKMEEIQKSINAVRKAAAALEKARQVL